MNAVVERIECCVCGTTYVHDGAAAAEQRSAARRARWEPYSTRTQAALDSGPMVCPDCVISAIQGAMESLRIAPSAKVTGDEGPETCLDCQGEDGRDGLVCTYDVASDQRIGGE